MFPLVSVNGNHAYKDGSVGKPIPCCEVKIVDEDENGEGEILVRGDNVMLGYYKNEAETGKVMRDGWFCTGDLGISTARDIYLLRGEKKNLIVLEQRKKYLPGGNRRLYPPEYSIGPGNRGLCAA